MLDSEVRNFGAFGAGFEEISLVDKLDVNAVMMLNMTNTLTMEYRSNGLKMRGMMHDTDPFLGVLLLLWGINFSREGTVQGLLFWKTCSGRPSWL